MFVDNLNSMASASGSLSNELSMSIQSIVEQLKTGSLEYLEASSNQQKFINNLQDSQAAVAETHSALIATIKALRSEFQ